MRTLLQSTFHPYTKTFEKRDCSRCRYFYRLAKSSRSSDPRKRSRYPRDRISLPVAQKRRELSLISFNYAVFFPALGRLIATRLVFHDRSNLSTEKWTFRALMIRATLSDGFRRERGKKFKRQPAAREISRRSERSHSRIYLIQELRAAELNCFSQKHISRYISPCNGNKKTNYCPRYVIIFAVPVFRYGRIIRAVDKIREFFTKNCKL